MEGGWRKIVGMLEGGCRKVGGRLEECWREGGRKVGGKLKGGWRELEGAEFLGVTIVEMM